MTKKFNRFKFRLRYKWKRLCNIPKSVYLSLRFPFLYPRNRFSGLHYNSWKISNRMKDLYAESTKIKDDGSYQIEVVDRFKWIRYNILRFIHDYVLQVIFCIPTYTELDAMDKGWRNCFGIQMCKEIKTALLAAGGRKLLRSYRIMQIKEKFGCYDEETEVLTKSGFKYFKDLDPADEIATLNSKGELEYNIPTNYISNYYNGLMYVLQNRGVDIKVTPNHNLYVAKGSYFYHAQNNRKVEHPFELTTPDTYFGKDKRFKKGCVWHGMIPNDMFTIPDYNYINKGISKKGLVYDRHYTIKGKDFPIIPFLRFLGFYVAEGYSSCFNGNGSDIRIAFNPYKEEDLVKDLTEGIGFSPKIYPNGLASFSFAPLAVWLRENCGHLAQNKKVPDFIKDLDSLYIQEFLKYLFIGDGHQAKTSNILTTSKKLKDDVCELLLKCGYSFRVYERKKRKKNLSTINNKVIHSKLKVYEINWLKNTYVEIETSKTKEIKNFKETWEQYSGYVFCVTIKNHIIYVRRNGKGYWCGNSLCWYDGGAPEDVNKIIQKYEFISFRTCIDCGEPAAGYTEGWIEPYCDKCAEKRGVELRKFGTEDNTWYGYYQFISNKKED